MQDVGALPRAFNDPVHDAQDTFRRLMSAYSCPASICECPALAPAPGGMNAVTAALLLSLADSDTPIWLDPGFEGIDEISAYLRFYTGAKFTSEPGQATFAVADGTRDPDLFQFATGTLEYPDRSATVIIQVERLLVSGIRFTGPGLKAPVMLSASPLWDTFEDNWNHNRELFPCGLDVILAAPTQLAALPRSLRTCGD